MNNFKLPTKIGETTTVVRTSDNYCNITEMYKQYNEMNGTDKTLRHFKEQDYLPEYIEGVCEYLNSHKSDIRNSLIADNQPVTQKDLIKSAKGGKYGGGSTWAHPLIALEAAAYLNPKLRVAANVALMESFDRSKKRINLSDRTKQLNSKVCKLNSAYSDSLYESSKLIKSTHRKINNLAFGEHYDGIRDDRNTYEDLQKLNEAFNTIEQIVDSSSNIEEFVNKCKNI